MLAIQSHWVGGAVRKSTPNKTAGSISPKFIVMHYTAGWTAASALSTFASSASKVSSQIVLDHDGTIFQLMGLNEWAWHAGPSSHMGYSGLNGHSIGIEIVYPGWLKKRSDGNFLNYAGSVRTPEQIGPVIAQAHPRVGAGMLYWPAFTDAQLETLDGLVAAIVQTYGILDIVSHEEIDTRGWKTDPGPAFPMQRYKALLGGRDLDADTYLVTASSLNVRSGPGTSFHVISKFTAGVRLTVLETRGDWGRVSTDGWVHMAYVKRV